MLNKTYTIQVTITEGHDEFWEDLEDKSGCDEVVNEVNKALLEKGFYRDNCDVRLIRFEER